MDFHLLDDHHIEVLAGDLNAGIWNFAKGIMSKDGEDSVNLEKNTRSMEIRLKKKVSNLDTMSELPVGGLTGAALNATLGPVGGLLSSALGFVAGKQDFFCVGCQLQDGRKFIARMRGTVLKELRKFCSNVKEKEK